MARVLCVLDDRRDSAAAVGPAVDFSREHGGDLMLVGVVRPLRAAVQPSHGELVRRYGDVESRVLDAAAEARSKGVGVKIVYRSGDPETEVMREAQETGASDVFLAIRGHGLKGLLDRKPASVTHVTLPAERKTDRPSLRRVA